MKVFSTEGLKTANTDFTTGGWKILSRTIDIAANFVTSPVVRFTVTGTIELDIQGEITEVAYSQGNQTEIAYKEYNFSAWYLPPTGGYEGRFFSQKINYGTPFMSNMTMTLESNTQMTINAKSKDYATSHSVMLKVYCNDWSKVTISYP